MIDGLQFSHNRGEERNQRTRQGCYTEAPYIWHCSDDRGAGNNSGENILVNPQGNILNGLSFTVLFMKV